MAQLARHFTIVDHNPSGTVTKVTRNLLGARGIDRISITENSATTHGFSPSPRVIVSRGGGRGVGYDGHGNCRAILTKNGTSYGTGNWRTYDVWGSVRSGSATGDPKSRYVASIGHVADDESSLTYMRARYYEPATGRFLSEDPAMDGLNWYVYCSNSATNRVDKNGCWDEWSTGFYLAGLGLGMAAWQSLIFSHGASRSAIKEGVGLAVALAGAAVLVFMLALGAEITASGLSKHVSNMVSLVNFTLGLAVEHQLTLWMASLRGARKMSTITGIGNRAMGLWLAYGLAVFAAILAIDANGGK